MHNAYHQGVHAWKYRNAIQAFVAGKTVAELEALLTSGENVVDAISGATLVAAPGYLQGIIDAAKAAK